MENATMVTQSPPMDVQPAPAEQHEGNFSFLGFAWRRKWIVVFIALIALGLGYLHFMRQTPVFQSSAQILVMQDEARLPISGVNADTSYDKTHELLLRSPVIVEKAVKKHNLASLPSLKTSGNPVSTIISRLGVSGSDERDGDIVRFTYSSSNRDDCPIVLDAVIDAYQDFLGETRQNLSQETIDLITQAKDELDKQISQQSAEYQKFRFEAPLIFTTGGGGRNAHEERLSSIEGVRSGVVLENAKIQARIEGIEAALKRGGNREAINLMVGHVAQGAGAGRTLEDQLWPMMLEEQMMLEKFGPDHPKVKTLRKRMQLTREHLMGKQVGDQEPKDFFQVYLESLREQIKLNEATLAEMNELYDQERAAAKELVQFQVSDEAYREGIARKERLFDSVINRLEQINLTKDTGGTETQVVSKPSTGRQIAPDMKKILVTASMLGLLGGLGLAFVVDMADRRFRSPDDIQNQLGLPVIGHVPVIRSERQATVDADINGAKLDPTLSTVHNPRGRVAESYRAVRTALYFSTRGSGRQVIQVTSPHAGDGKTTLASNLAVSIANSGKKTLLLEADFRKPRCHRIFDLDNSIGVSTVISEDDEFAEAVQETAIENLFVMACGPRPANPAELLTTPKFHELIELAREKYDFIIVDTPPLLVVTDPSTVAPRVDGVVLVMRLTKRTRESARRARELLDSLGANVLGIVVNGVSRSGGYGYGNAGYKYTYGRAYGYARGYGYGYGYGDGYYDSYGYYEDRENRSRTKT